MVWVRWAVVFDDDDSFHFTTLQQGGASSLVPFSGCMSARGGKAQGGILHAWDVVVKFYEMKGGAEFNSAPARRLSRSFGLDLAGSTSSNKQVKKMFHYTIRNSLALKVQLGLIFSKHIHYVSTFDTVLSGGSTIRRTRRAPPCFAPKSTKIWQKYAKIALFCPFRAFTPHCCLLSGSATVISNYFTCTTGNT